MDNHGAGSAMPKIGVVIVDDIADTRENFSKLLMFERDIEVIGMAGSGPEAIEVCRKLRPDVVLMDINMPEMDGIKAAEILSTELPGIGIIMMSVQSEQDYLRRAMLAGAREFLVKPCSGDDLIRSIRHVYRLEASKRALAASVPAPGTAMLNGKVTEEGESDTARSLLSSARRAAWGEPRLRPTSQWLSSCDAKEGGPHGRLPLLWRPGCVAEPALQ